MLAAGSSQRLGAPKQLLQVGNQLLINHMIQIIRGGGIEDLTIILGYEFERIREVIQDQAVRILKNDLWEQGISSSVRVGLEEIGQGAQEVIIFVVDQPFLIPELIYQFVSHYVANDPGILATRVGEQLCHPVLFTRKYFHQLANLSGDAGGKQLFQHHPVDYFDWYDKRLVLDIDTQFDYEKYQELSNDSLSRAA